MTPSVAAPGDTNLVTPLFRGDISPVSFLVFTGGGSENVKFDLDHSTTLVFEPLSFRNAVRYLKSKVHLLRFDDCSRTVTDFALGLRPRKFLVHTLSS